MVATFDILVRDFPTALAAAEMSTKHLHQIIQSILLVAIAAELGFVCFLFTAPGAAIEVVIFVIGAQDGDTRPYWA